jgi:ferric-dicitrate binding protein FerR (iron transport regulator)
MNDPAETLVTQSLASHAAEAPSDTTLLGTVHRRLRRRRRTRAAGVVVLACAAVIVAAAGVQSLTRPEDAGPAASPAQPPPGWHWES